MKTILCFGDSITWGYNPKDATRLPPEHRWPNILSEALGPDVEVIAEGLNGRTLAVEDPLRPDRGGLAKLPFLLESHAPLDTVIIMLGTNDCAPCYKLTIGEIALACARLIMTVKQSLAGPGGTAPATLLISPPHMGELEPTIGLFYNGGQTLCTELAEAYRMVATSLGTAYLDAAPVASPDEPDGVHLGPDGQRKLALAVKDVIAPLL
ncbi:SGNH/GDSL hydrolase family protein [Methyloligella solikamskensis]|uniref:SGNH/GDSL hydrolase family protein n=1 Tax=Methyloligella solikamskensis TaxID=1177756 RepID=A0ABW3J9B6_9HYPH